jgi:hypothetical protein
MGIQLNHISGLTLALVAAAAIAAPVGHAQEAPQTIPDAFDELMSTYSGDYFRNQGISRRALRLVGFSFPEREVEWDSNATNAATRDLWRLQHSADPTVRVPDLTSPYTTTLLTMPSSRTPSVGSEFIFESF